MGVRLLKVIRIDEEEAAVVRPKRLALSDSGVREAVRVGHVESVATSRPDACADSVTATAFRGSLRNPVAGAFRAVAAHVLDESMREAGLANADLGAVLNVSESRARLMRLGQHPFELWHVLACLQRAPENFEPLRRALLDLLARRPG